MEEKQKVYFNVHRGLIKVVLLLVVASAIVLSVPSQTNAATGIRKTINFQGRLMNAQGATVPDGYYNVQFKIYQDGDGTVAGNTAGSPAGTLKWTESYLNNATQGVMVRNGYMSVELGSITAFGTNIDFNQDTLWLSMNVGSTNTTCTPFTSCTPDGEMLPMKRLSSAPYALNSAQLNGLSSTQFVQLAQGVQTDASTNTSSIFINKTSTGNLLQLQNAATDAFTVSNNGDLTFGSNASHTLSVATAASGTAGKSLNVLAGAGGAGTGFTGGNLILQGGAGGGTNGSGGSLSLDAGSPTGTGAIGSIYIGTGNAASIQIGSVTTATGTQTIGVGTNNTAGSTTNVTIGSGSSATGGLTTVQSKTSIVLNTNGVARAIIDNAGVIYLGNGVTAAAPSNFAISGTASTTAATAGGALTVQGGNATTGNTNGGNLILAGGNGSGTGSSGLIVLNTPAFATTVNDSNCYTSGALVAASCTIAATTVNNSSSVLVGFNSSAKIATLPNPTITTAGKIIYVTAANGSMDFTLSVNGGGVGNLIAMRQNTTATMIWNGTAWTAAGASSSTTLQSAYDNTLQSAGGAELVVSKTGTTNGLNIRDSATNPVNGTLLSVQTASAATILSVNGNVTEYASDAGAEVAGGTASTFPASTWAAIGGAGISRYTTVGNNINTGQASVGILTGATVNDGLKNTLTGALGVNTVYNVSFSARLQSGSFTDMSVYYSADGSTTLTTVCDATESVPTSVWKKVTCSFTAPSSGITSANAILIRQNTGVSRTFFIDNLSVTIAGNFNYVTDGGADNSANFTTNWSAIGAATVSRSTTVGNDASSSVQVQTTGANQGVKGKLSVNPLPSTLYRVTAYVSSTTTGFNNFTVQYSRDGTNTTSCTDYNTQTISSSTSTFTQITCYITTDATASTTPYLFFGQTDSTARTFYVDTVSMTLNSAGVPNVQIGGGVSGGPTTLLTLDRGASAPIATNNDALLGSMYYDTTLGKLQCYEADGWGACGSSPDNVITISPEYTNAVLHGTGIGTMTSDICSGTLNINNGTSGQPNVCATNETYNFYRWTSPQASAQTYSIYVTYQLPSTFKTFGSGQTSVKGRTDSANATVNYQVYRSNSTSGLLSCGSTVAVSTGIVSSWQTGTASGAADPSTCGFIAGDSIVFKINMTASTNANAYVGNLNFIFSNR